MKNYPQIKNRNTYIALFLIIVLCFFNQNNISAEAEEATSEDTPMGLPEETSNELETIPQTENVLPLENIPEVVQVPIAPENTEGTIEPETVIETYLPPKNLPKINTREHSKKINLDPNAKHACASENFFVNITNSEELTKKINLSSQNTNSKELEILGAPLGFEITWKSNDQKKINLSLEKRAELLIKKNPNAQKGSFNVSITFTEKDGNSSVLCQINLINNA